MRLAYTYGRLCQFLEYKYHVFPADIAGSIEEILSCRSLKTSSCGRGERWRASEVKRNLLFG
jgi:hypothetical protein